MKRVERTGSDPSKISCCVVHSLMVFSPSSPTVGTLTERTLLPLFLPIAPRRRHHLLDFRSFLTILRIAVALSLSPLANAMRRLLSRCSMRRHGARFSSSLSFCLHIFLSTLSSSWVIEPGPLMPCLLHKRRRFWYLLMLHDFVLAMNF